MIKTAFIFLIIFFSIFLELSFGGIGIVFPATACAVFYISVNYGWRLTVIIALLSGLVIDVLFGRQIFYTPYTLLVITVFGRYWLHKGVLKALKIQIFPGLINGVVYSAPLFLFLYGRYQSGFLLFLFNFSNFLLTVALGGMLMPFTVLLLDTLSEKFELPIYTKAKINFYHSN
ncbi:MAG: hypothetical protein K9M56_05360 [Victivallales bacterium]|nr:hypothetical protein [Victivallales bacterium]